MKHYLLIAALLSTSPALGYEMDDFPLDEQEWVRASDINSLAPACKTPDQLDQFRSAIHRKDMVEAEKSILTGNCLLAYPSSHGIAHHAFFWPSNPSKVQLFAGNRPGNG